ncbi:Sugar transferase involved in LPS biosynthesis (colanic, teichoic acid) [Succiniclasticum ruminis]|uniref:Sugar transferase involved in LPS biosynthesis (Colanic, teichoic acid) n=1 Tax=Succiniclasticum ruminis TaxID=40841 RepID=A0A1G6HRK3_9FIRM|nr:sugar transferase [Succiniclasticum ruminis]SDB96841.1 Sugar transferase involved in LPS biosynthesis (colanic, teichoic acid) [Succiniclasticum ruminis]
METNLPRVKRTFYSTVVKRLIDIVLSGMAIIFLSPLLLTVCMLELIFHGRPIIYNTKRPGKDAKIFNMYKFRSMTNERGEDGYLLPEEKRLTKFGHFIRKTSIDELPGLFNILKGDMSIVGPRPLLVEYLQYYSPRHAMRHAVRPGFALQRIVGPESNTWTWREQFENDIWYIENISFWVDVKMILAIAKAVFRASETRANANRAPFDGTNLDETRSVEELGIVKYFDSLEQRVEP